MRHLKILDYAGIILSVCIIFVFSIQIYGSPSDELFVHIKSPNKEWVYPIDANVTVNVEGPIGITKVHLHDNTAAIVDSPCPHKICIRAGELSANGDWASCLPNRVFVRVKGERKEELDAVSY